MHEIKITGPTTTRQPVSEADFEIYSIGLTPEELRAFVEKQIDS